MLGSIAVDLAKSIILPEIAKVLRRDEVPVAPRDIGVVSEAIARQIAPQMVHEANAEPWYQSRVTIGALVSIGTGVLALSGIILTPEDTALIVSVATSIGAVAAGALTLYGRWKAKKPIGQ